MSPGETFLTRNSMGNQKKKQKDPVLLGVPNGAISENDDTDAYITKIGGVPIWLDPERPPSPEILTCKICKKPKYLIFQGYAPLNNSAYHRVIYVWGCNNRGCMRKEGSFSVLRSHLVDPEYLAAQKRKEEEKRKKEELRKQQASPFGAGGFQLGDLWGAAPTSMMQNTMPTFASMASKTADSSKKDPLAESLAKMSLNATPRTVIPPEAIVSFPAVNLWIDEEDLTNLANMGIDMSRYQHYVDMENELLESAADEEWSGEAYEKQHLPRGVDKLFKKFMERVECEPSQCVRYEMGGTPLLYHQLQKPPQAMAGRCNHCGAPRIFELQLMPNILSVLPVSDYASTGSTDGQNKRINSWDVGMEFGTVLVFVCEKDCHPDSMELPSHVEEYAIVQYEQD
ncbi:programmed cell death protein 2 [Dichotomocladium elegans]|nr:programmed cell death protein 2 [Dichotomocladium elegans]